MKTLKQLLTSINDNLIVKTRDNGDQFYCFKNDAPEWCADIAHHVHDGMMPDDWRYKFLANIIDVLAQYDIYQLEDLVNGDYDVYEIIGDPDVYNATLLQWQASNLSRMEYADYVLQEFNPTELWLMLQKAQEEEKKDVLNLVLSWLEDQQYELWKDVA